MSLLIGDNATSSYIIVQIVGTCSLYNFFFSSIGVCTEHLKSVWSFRAPDDFDLDIKEEEFNYYIVALRKAKWA